ncbi:MAG: hypothetical protein V4629_07770 [Pseudomonadota bacterium]
MTSIFAKKLIELAQSRDWQVVEDRLFGFGALLGWCIKTSTHEVTLNVQRNVQDHEDLLLVYVQRCGAYQNLKHSFRPIAHILQRVMQVYPAAQNVVCQLTDLSGAVTGGLASRRLKHYVEQHLKAESFSDAQGKTWWRISKNKVFQVASGARSMTYHCPTADLLK